MIYSKEIIVFGRPGRAGGGGTSLEEANGEICHWMGSHFHDWIDYNGVAFSRVTRMGSHIFGFLE